MSVFENLSDVRKMTFNGVKPKKIIFNGVDVLRDGSEVFKDGVLNEDCTISGEIEHSGESLSIKAATKENNARITAEGWIGMDVTDYSRLKISGEYYSYHGMDADGSSSIMIGFVGDDKTILYNTTPESGEFTLEFDVSDKSGMQDFSVLCIVQGGKNIAETYDQCYTECYINEMLLE